MQTKLSSLLPWLVVTSIPSLAFAGLAEEDGRPPVGRSWIPVCIADIRIYFVRSLALTASAIRCQCVNVPGMRLVQI